MANQKQVGTKFDKRTLSIILYLISRLNGVLGKTHLQKLLFMTDLISSKRFQEKMTAIEYKRYLHGPYSSQLDDYTDFLIKEGLIESKELPFISNPSKKYFRYYSKKPVAIKQSLLKNLGSEKMLLIDDVIGSFGNMSLKDVLEVVYNLQIVKDSKMDKPLEMAKRVDKNSEDNEEDEIDLFND